MAYATVEDVQARIDYTLSESQTSICENLLEDAAVLIDSYKACASGDAASFDTDNANGYPSVTK